MCTIKKNTHTPTDTKASVLTDKAKCTPVHCCAHCATFCLPPVRAPVGRGAPLCLPPPGWITRAASTTIGSRCTNPPPPHTTAAKQQHFDSSSGRGDLPALGTHPRRLVCGHGSVPASGCLGDASRPQQFTCASRSAVSRGSWLLSSKCILRCTKQRS